MTRRNQSHDAVQRRQRTLKRLTLVMGGIFLIVLAGAFFFDEMGLPKYLRMKERERQLEQEIKELERTNTELKTEIRRVQQDPARIEELARERLGFVRPGETVYQIVKEKSK